MNRRFNNRAVSQVIAALLLIAIAVAAAVLLYVFSIGLLGSLGTAGGQQTKDQVVMEAYNFVASPLVISLRNVGSASVNIGSADYFINGVKVTTPTAPGGGMGSLQSCTSLTSFSPGTVCAVSLPYAGTLSSLISGVAYPLKVVTPDGGVFSYTVTYGTTS